MSQIEFLSYFEELEDPRDESKKLHSLSDILLIVFLGSICGADSWRDLVDFAESKYDYLKRYSALTYGIPSKNTLNRVVANLNPEHFKTCFIEWMKAFQEEVKDIIAIDGKTLRKSFDKASEQSPIHMVSAFATATKLVLGQEKVNEKSNEITAIPKLLRLLDIKGAVVTLDAMGCQKNIAKQIKDQGGEYVLALKGNQEHLYHDVVRHFRDFSERKTQSDHYYETREKAHGREEHRECLVSEAVQGLRKGEQWEGLKSIVAMRSVRTIGTDTTVEVRYFLSSLEANAKEISRCIREHWLIENSLHWTLDVVFNEDDSRNRLKNIAENMAMIRHVALNQLQKAKPNFRKDMSIKGLRKKAGWDDTTLDIVTFS